MNGHMGSPSHVCHNLYRPLVGSQNTLPVCFLAIIPLEKNFDWGGEQLSLYCGPDLGGLITITLNKYVHLLGV